MRRLLTRDEALRSLRRASADAQPAGPTWPCRIGPVSVRFPNFAWRRSAIRAHDLHHQMAGYPMTLRGEFQMAAWELGAGWYPHWGATCFCGPLLLAGLFWSPRKMIAAYKAGCRTTSLYSALDEEA